MTTHVLVMPQTSDAAVTVTDNSGSHTFIVPRSCVRHLVVLDEGSSVVVSGVLQSHLAGPLRTRPLPVLQQDVQLDARQSEPLLGRSH